MKDQLDAKDVAWFKAPSDKGEECHVCGVRYRTTSLVLVERVLPHVKPRTMHRTCWAEHERRLAEAL